MKQIINKLIAGGAIALTTVACTGDYLDINTNPYEPSDLTPDGYALVSSMNNIAGTVIPSDVNCAQFTDCLQGGTLGGYFADGANFLTSFIRYNAPDNWTSVFLADSKIISTLYSNLSLVEGFCETSGQKVPMAVANIMKVATMSRVTDTYGPIPYTQIGYEGIIQTPYDSQETVYRAFFDDLDAAIAELNANRGEQLNPTCDYIYAGDVQKWIKFANSLKLRLAMRIVYADRTLAQQKAEEAIDPANGGVIESNDENASWKYFTASTNPLYTAVNYNNTNSSTGGDTHAAADIICYMNGYNDPRREPYFLKSVWPGIEYVGLRRGWASYNTSWGFNFCGVNVKANDPLMWQNAAEVAFLRAEATAVFGFNMGGTAEHFYNTGIELSFEQWGVSGADEYMADETSVPERYNDPSNINPWTGTLPSVTIKWDESATTEQKQERIIVQKWIANYMLGNEAWADVRRTGYPKLIPVAFNGSNGVVDTNRGPERMPYPQSEYTNNGASVQAAVANYLKGPDNMGTKVWWACKPGL